MQLKKSLLVAGAVTTVGLTGLAGVGVASAATQASSSADPMSSLVDKLANKFNLNKADVQSVFDEERQARETEREQQFTAKIDQLVSEGKLTSGQKDAIIAKRAEIKKDMDANRDSMKDKTATERKAAMDQKRTELEEWAKDNGIDTQYLPLLMGGGHGGPGRMMGPRPSSDTSSNDTSSSTN